MMELLIYIMNLIQQLLLIVMILLSVAFFTLMERKVLGYIHYRKGPNKVIINGFLQPIVDAIKLMTKDDFPVLWSNKWVFYLAPVLLFFISLYCWMIFPFVWGKFCNNYSFITLIVIFGLTVFGSMLSGWSSNSTYSMLGSVRSVSQSISYEVVIGFINLSIICLIASYSIDSFYWWNMMKIFIVNPILFFVTMISVLAELNRTPFDLSEGESELVSGYSVEYGGVLYIILFLSENVFIIFSSFIITFFFFNNLTSISMMLFFCFIIYMICLIRGILPRYRYDKLMMFSWLLLLPLTIMLYNYMILISMIMFN